MGYKVKSYDKFINEHLNLTPQQALAILQKWAKKNSTLITSKTNYSFSNSEYAWEDGHDICTLIKIINDVPGDYFYATSDSIHIGNANNDNTDRVDMWHSRHGGHILTTGDMYLELAYKDWVPFTEEYLKRKNLDKLELTKRQVYLIKKYYPEFAKEKRGVLSGITYNI